MGSDETDVDNSIREVDLRDQAILVAADVEDNPTALEDARERLELVA